MALVFDDRVKETSTTTGTGTYNLAGAVTGFQTFVAGIGTGNTCYYCAEDGTNWEVGLGTVTDASPDTLARTTILSSSNADAAVNWGAGTRNMFCTIPGSKVATPGKQTVWVPATAMVKNNAAAGPAVGQFINVSTVFNYLAFDAAADEDAHFTVAMPKNWDEGSVSYQVYWLHPATATNFTVVWSAFVISYSNDESIAGTPYDGLGNEVDVGGTTSDLYISNGSTPVAVTGAAEGDSLHFIIRRSGTNGSDTMTVDAYLIGVKIHYTTNAFTDA